MTENDVPRMGYTRIPNVFFDEILPALTDSEMRVLLIVLRSTIGWLEITDTGKMRPKERDWISHSQMQKRTGRSSASVSAAIQGLINRKLLSVEDQRSNKLHTPDERRLNMGKLYFVPVEMWTNPVHMWITPRNPVNANVLFTKDRTDKINKGNGTKMGYRALPARSSTGFEHVGAILDTREL